MLRQYARSVKFVVGSVDDWLERRNCDQHGLGSKPTRAILFSSGERHFTTFFLLSNLSKQF